MTTSRTRQWIVIAAFAAAFLALVGGYAIGKDLAARDAAQPAQAGP